MKLKKINLSWVRRSQSGTSLVEYAMILSLVVLVVWAALSNFGQKTSSAIVQTANTLSSTISAATGGAP